MKLAKGILKTAIGYVSVAILFYVLTSVVEKTFDFEQWREGAAVFFAFLVLLFGTVAQMAIHRPD